MYTTHNTHAYIFGVACEPTLCLNCTVVFTTAECFGMDGSRCGKIVCPYIIISQTQTQTQTGTNTHTHTHTQTHRETHTHTATQTHTQTHRHTDTHTQSDTPDTDTQLAAPLPYPAPTHLGAPRLGQPPPSTPLRYDDGDCQGNSWAWNGGNVWGECGARHGVNWNIH